MRACSWLSRLRMWLMVSSWLAVLYLLLNSMGSACLER